MTDAINNFIKVKVPTLKKPIDDGSFMKKLFNPMEALKTGHLVSKDPFYLMEVLPSTVKGAGLGTFATNFIPKDTDLGKYYGDVLTTQPANTDYAWTIFDKDTLGNTITKWVDGINYKDNNPLRYVNSPIKHSEKNIVNTIMFMKEGDVHYKSTRDIKKGEELFIDYGDAYWTSRKKSQTGGFKNINKKVKIFDLNKAMGPTY